MERRPPTFMSSHPITLADIAVGCDASVVQVVGTDSLTVRLLEMGMTPGTSVAVVGKAPLGDPIEVGLRRYRLSLRRSEARRIIVSRWANPASQPAATGG
jgi:ferrous iron transport protein A